MRQISQTGKEMLLFQEELARKHKYEPVPINLFTGNVRDKYEENECDSGNGNDPGNVDRMWTK